MNHLKQRIDDLKFLIEFPKYFIADYFQSLKNEIDIGFARDGLFDDKKENWLKMINIIEAYEGECFHKFKPNIVSAFRNYLKLIQSNTYDYSVNELDILIDKEEKRLQQTLLMNKSFHFIDKSKCDEINEKKLVIIDNNFISNQAIDFLKISQSKSNELMLNEEYIKVKELKSKLIHLNGEILTISLDLTGKKSLDLFQSQIKSINTFAFYNLKNLQSLYLNNNNIISIDSNIFVNLVNLKQLYLFENKITSISKSSFIGLNNLEWLNLSKNHINCIEGGSFLKLNKLKRLYLQNNELSQIDEATLQGLKSLEMIILSNNQIENLASNAFYDLKHLKEIDLSNNRIHSLDLSLFDSLSHLNLLYLYSNLIDLSLVEKFSKCSKFNIFCLDQ